MAGIVWAQDLLRLMGADAWAIEHGYRYTQWMLGGNAVILLLFVINAIFQIPLAWVLALPLGWMHSGVFWGVFVSETAVGVFTLWLFSRGRWKTARV